MVCCILIFLLNLLIASLGFNLRQYLKNLFFKSVFYVYFFYLVVQVSCLESWVPQVHRFSSSFFSLLFNIFESRVNYHNLELKKNMHNLNIFSVIKK